MTTPTFKTFADNKSVAENFAADLVKLTNVLLETQSRVTIALSGGSTPKLMFQILADQFRNEVAWENVHFFWGDERCVPPDDDESNYGLANQLFFQHVSIPDKNVHRVHGEAEPAQEAVRYAHEIATVHGATDDATPNFDIVILGMGSDGHTASIFPHEMKLLQSDQICEVATHPESGQKRITLTGKVLNAARNLFFLITGESKADVLAEIANEKGQYKAYPTSFVKPNSGSIFYIDEAAGASLGK